MGLQAVIRLGVQDAGFFRGLVGRLRFYGVLQGFGQSFGVWWASCWSRTQSEALIAFVGFRFPDNPL